MKLIWRKNFEIKRVGLNIISESQHGIYDLQDKIYSQKGIKKLFVDYREFG